LSTERWLFLQVLDEENKLFDLGKYLFTFDGVDKCAIALGTMKTLCGRKTSLAAVSSLQFLLI